MVGRILRRWLGRQPTPEPVTTGNVWADDFGNVIFRVHDEAACEGRGCPIHHPSEHHMRDWPRLWRYDRRLMERICEHGVGHPDPDDIRYQYEELGAPASVSVHGCCGCCKPQPWGSPSRSISTSRVRTRWEKIG